MLDIKAHKPQSKVPIFYHRCECGKDVYLITESRKHEGCGRTLSLLGSFWILLEYATRAEILKILGKDYDTLSLMKAKIKEWGDLGNDEKPFEFSEKNIKLLHDAKPDIANLIPGLCQVRNLFGLVDLEDFAKKSNGQSTTRKDTGKVDSRQIAESASKSTEN